MANSKHRWGVHILAALLIATSTGWTADEDLPHSMPYQAFHAMLKLGTSGTNGVDTNCFFVVTSSLPDVALSDIIFTIRSTNRTYDVHLNDSGYPIDFPLTPELLAENPPITVNQPPGTVNVSAQTGFTEPQNGPIGEALKKWVGEIVRDGLRLQDDSVSYQALHHLLRRSPTFRATVAEDESVEEKDLQADLTDVEANPVELEYKGTEAAGIRIQGANESMEIPVDASGRVVVPVSESLWAANPMIEFYPSLADWCVRDDSPEHAAHSLSEIFEQCARRFSDSLPAESGAGN